MSKQIKIKKEKSPLISVVIFSYNFEKYIEECIESILAQMLLPEEIIISDDSSTDNTWKIIQKFQKKYPDLIKAYQHSKNIGMIENNIFAIKKSTGKYISFIDGDDRWLPGKLKHEYDALLKSPNAQVAFSNVIIINESGEKIKTLELESHFNMPSGDLFVPVFAKRFFQNSRSVFRCQLMTSKALNEVGFEDRDIAVHTDWNVKLKLAAKYDIVYSGDALVEYRQNNNGIHMSKAEMIYDSAKTVVEKNEHLLETRTEQERKFVIDNIQSLLKQEYDYSEKAKQKNRESEKSIMKKPRNQTKMGNNLIFVISQPRAGSTLMQRVLGSHPEIHAVAEPWVMLHPLYALKKQGIQTEYGANYAVQALEDFVAEMPKGREDYLNGLRKMATSWYNSILKSSNSTYFLDKTPRYYYILEELHELFPTAKKVILLRNPLAVLSSVLKTWVQDDWNRLTLHRDDLLKAPGFLVNAIKSINENLIVVRYEDVVKDPTSEFKQICNQLAVEFDTDILEYGKSEEPKGRMGDAVGIKKHGRPVSASLQKWHATYTRTDYKFLAEIYIHLLGADTLEGMGYNYKELKSELEKINNFAKLSPDEITVIVASLNLSKEKLNSIEPIIAKYLNANGNQNKQHTEKLNSTKSDAIKKVEILDFNFTDYYQPALGETEAAIKLEPHKLISYPISTVSLLHEYAIRDFGQGQDAALKILNHIAQNKFKAGLKPTKDFWINTIVLKTKCSVVAAKTNTKFSLSKPVTVNQICASFNESEERIKDIEVYAESIKKGISLGYPLYISGRALNKIMQPAKAEDKAIYMLDGARRIAATALAHKDAIEIMLIIDESEFADSISNEALSKLKNKMQSLTWFNNYQSIPLIGLNGERSAQRFNLFDVNILQGQVVMDFGCNIGQACLKAIQAGAKTVIGIEGMADTYDLACSIKNLSQFENLNYLNIDFNKPDFDEEIDSLYPNKVDYSFFFSVYRTKELTQRDKLFQYIIAKTEKGIFFEGHADPKIDSIEYYDWLFSCFNLNYQFLGYSEGNIRPLFYLPRQKQDKSVVEETKQDKPLLGSDLENYQYVITAIVSTYKSERFIGEKLKDLCNQTLGNRIEIIVIDSNSPENEKEIVEKYPDLHENIKYVRTNKRETVYQAWNRGIKMASGKYITNANTDDRLRNDALEVMVATLENYPDVDLVYGDFFITGYENMTVERHIRTGYSVKPEFDPSIMLHGCHMGPQPVWRKSVHEEVGYFDDNLKAAGDYEFWCRLVAKGKKFKHISSFLGLYLHNGSGIINSDQDLANNETQQVREKYSSVLPAAAQNLPVGFYYQDKVSTDNYVNITMVTYNRLDFTQRAIESIFSLTRFPYVLTVVDNNSKDGSRDYLQTLHERGVITNLVLLDENIGVAKAANMGWLIEPNANYYMKYDNDIVVQKPDWLNELIQVVDAIQEAGAVAYNFEPVSYPLIEKNGIQLRVKEEGNLGGACICIPKRTHLQLGFWNEEYGLYGEEDADYGHRIKHIGLLNVYMSDENIGLHLPAGKAAVIDHEMVARDGLEESTHTEYRQFKDQKRKENMLSGKFEKNLEAYKKRQKELYVRSAFSGNSDVGPATNIDSKLPKIGFLSIEDHRLACPYLRLASPLNLLHKYGEIEYVNLALDEKMEITVKQLSSVDILIIQRNIPDYLPFDQLKALFKNLTTQPKLVFEFDDAFGHVYKNHLAYDFYKQMKPKFEEYLKNVDLVTVSTEKLKEYYQNLNPNFAVLPNAINEDLWQFAAKDKTKKSDKVRILFSGTITHDGDLAIIKAPLQRILKEYKNKVDILFWGSILPELAKLPNVHVLSEFNPNYLQYAELLQQLEIDFALVPLKNDPFNEAKSHIKWLEYSACGIPAIFSEIGEYKIYIENGKTGVLVKNNSKTWYTAIKNMIDKSQQREKIARQAQDEVRQNHTLKSKIHLWKDVYKKVLNNQTEKTQSKVSIIIPVFNKVEFTEKCITAILKNTSYSNYEIIVVNNASTDETRNYLEKAKKDIEHLEIIHNSKNQGFSKANNQGVEKASGKYLVFLNNDTEVLPGWLESTLDLMERDPRIGIVGSKLIYPDSTIQHGGVALVDDQKNSDPLLALNVFVGKERKFNEANIVIEYQAVTAACMLVPKNLFEEAGGYDDKFWNGYEDIDFCLKIRELGYKVVYQPESEIIHYESQSGPERFKKAAENIQRLHRKWLGKVKHDFRIDPTGQIIQLETTPIKKYINDTRKEKDDNKPLASIIMLTCNALEMTKKCVSSIIKHTQYPYEIVFVDNGSKDGTQKYLENLESQYDNISTVYNKKNLGFSAGNNIGVKQAQGSYIILLNNDVLVADGWLSDMIDAFEKDQRIGMVSALTNKISGLQALTDVPYRDDSGYYEFADAIRSEHRGRLSPRRRLAGFMMLTSKKIYEEIKGFDESYGLGNFEDDDISLKIRDRGYALMVHEGTFIHHYAHSSFKANNIDLLQSLKENEKIFQKKWPNVDYEELLEIKNPLHEVHPLRVQMATKLMEDGNADQSVKIFKEVLKENPLSGEAMLGLALALRMLQKSEDALRYLNKALKLYPENPHVYNQLGMIAFDENRIAESLDYFKKAVQLDPAFYDAKRNYGQALIEYGEYEKGIEQITQNIQENPKDIVSLVFMAQLYLEIENIDQAKEYLDKANQIDPGNEYVNDLIKKIDNKETYQKHTVENDSFYTGAIELLNDFKTDEAESLFQKSYESSERPDSLFGLALCSIHKEQHIRATKQLTDLIEKWPEFAEAYNQLGILYHKNADLENALGFFAKAIEKDQNLISAQRNYGLCLIDTEDYENGIAVFNKILDKDPDDLETLLIMTGFYCELAKWEEANNLVRKVLNIDAQNSDALQFLKLIQENIEEVV